MQKDFRVETYIHTEQAHIGGNKWSREKESGKNKAQRGQEREREREMGWDVRLFATRMEQFTAKVLISSSEGKKMRKVKRFYNRSKEEAQTEFVLLDIPL